MYVNQIKFYYVIGFIAFSLGATSCTPTLEEDSATVESSSTETTQTEVTPASGAMAAKIIFKQANPSGSFNEPSSSGTKPTPGSGHQAVRIFNADGSLLAEQEDDDDEDSNWPNWLEYVEIGISGGNNTSATDADCAKFSGNEESSECDWNNNTVLPDLPTDDADAGECGGEEGYYRVSEFDCFQGDLKKGNGGPDDGVYIRASFSRDTEHLASYENILVTLEYSASVINPAPSDPTSCFSGGVFSPTSTDCSDMSWQIFMKHEEDDIVNPFMLLVPPAFASVDATTNRGGSGIGTKQFILPLAGDSNITTLQISRITAKDDITDFEEICVDNSPNCLGIIFYSMTFYRI